MPGTSPGMTRIVGWAKRSVPTNFGERLFGGHGASAPLPTLRFVFFVGSIDIQSELNPAFTQQLKRLRGYRDALVFLLQEKPAENVCLIDRREALPHGEIIRHSGQDFGHLVWPSRSPGVQSPARTLHLPRRTVYPRERTSPRRSALSGSFPRSWVTSSGLRSSPKKRSDTAVLLNALIRGRPPFSRPTIHA
jgi:hypothetical protein